MSKDNPGVIFDASNSWNGYNHQGKLAIWIAVKQILQVYNNSISEQENKDILKKYFIEIEYLEDFSLGEIVNGKEKYYFVHQVKNQVKCSPKDYDSALLGLAYHVKNMPDLKGAYLHVTTNIDFKEKDFHDYVKELINSPKDLANILAGIERVRKNEDEKKTLYEKKVGRPESFIVELKKALRKVDDNGRTLNTNNIDLALDALEVQTKKRLDDIRHLDDYKIRKINLFLYNIHGCEQYFCKVDQIEELIKSEIKHSINVFNLPKLWGQDRYVNNRYLYLLGKLDEHIIDRNLNYPLYNNNEMDRKILLSEIFDWLTSDEIETVDEEFYQYHLKNNFFMYALDYCQKCRLGECDTCLLLSAINKIGQLTKQEMKEFLILTCPSNYKGISMETIPTYLSKRRIQNPFFAGLKEIKIPFEEDKQAITYIDGETQQYILTTLEKDDEEDNGDICTDILRNKELYEMLMDYDCFISKNIKCSSIQGEAKKLGKSMYEDIDSEELSKEHIAHLKDVSIIKLGEFEQII